MIDNPTESIIVETQLDTKKPRRRLDLLVLLVLITAFVGIFIYFNFKKEDAGEQLRILWKFQGGKITKPITAGSTLYFASSSTTGGTTTLLYALDKNTGQVKWKVPVETSFFPPSPTVSKGAVYFVNSEGKLFAISIEDGKPLWSFDGKERPSRSSPFTQASPVVANGTVYFGGSQNFYALDTNNGKEIWQYKLNPVPQGDGTADKGLVQDPIVVANGVIYLADDNGRLYAIDAATGQKKLDEKIFTSITPSPLFYYKGSIYFVSTGKNKKIYKFSADTGGLVSEVNLSPTEGTVELESLAFGDGTLYFSRFFTQDFYAFDITTGKQKWFFKMKGHSGAFPKEVGDLVYIGNYEEDMFKTKSYLHVLNAKTGEEIWNLNINQERGVSSITVDDSAIYVVSGDFLYAVRR